MKYLKILSSAILVVAMLFSTACGGGQQLPSGAENLSNSQFSSAELENGLKVFSCPDPRNPITAVVARINLGAVDEGPGEEGYAAVYSRLISIDGSDQAARKIDALGSTLKIRHEAEAVVLYATVLKEDAQEAAELILDVISKQYTEREITKARDALVENFNRIKEAEQFQMQELLNRTLYPESSRGADVETRLKSLNSLSLDSFNAFLKKNVMPQRTLVALSGDITPELLSSFANKAAAWERGEEQLASEETNEEEKADEEKYTPIFVKNVRSHSAQLFMMRRLPPLNHQSYYETLAVNRILNGQSTFSRFAALQVALKLEAPIFSRIELNRKESAQIITASAPAKESYKTLSEVMKQMQVLYGGKLLNSRLLGQEISDARNFLKGQLIRRTESIDQFAEFVLWATDAGFEKVLPEEHLAMIDSITKENLLVVIESYFVPALNSLVAVGPSSMVSQFEKYFKVEIVD